MEASNLKNNDRLPAVAGRFYPESPKDLQNLLNDLFSQAKPRQTENTRAIITPHAGYVFSGIVAASAFNQIDITKNYQNIFIIGTSHTTYLYGASIYNQGDCIIPTGKIKVNKVLATKLIEKYNFFTFDINAHLFEHTIEVQLPFLKYKLENKPINIIPIIIGTQNITTIQKIAEALSEYFTPNNLFIISTDFSHYPPYNYAIEVDKRTAQAILSKDPETFLNTLKQNEQAGIPNLATSICGWSSVLTLMYLAQDNPGLEFKTIQYRNSGDSIYGDHSQVVGYYAISLHQTL